MTVDGNLFVSWKCENISQSVADQGPKELDPGLFPLIILVPHKGCKSHLCQLTIVLPMGRMLKYCCCCSIIKSCPTLCDPMGYSMPTFPVHHQLLELTHTHVHQVGDAIQPCHPLSSPSPLACLSQHQGLFQWVSSSHQWPKYWSFNFSTSPSNEYSGLRICRFVTSTICLYCFKTRVLLCLFSPLTTSSPKENHASWISE